MKNVFIILAMTLGLGFLSMLVTDLVIRSQDQNDSAKETAAITEGTEDPAIEENPIKMLQESNAYAGKLMNQAFERDRKSRIAGGIGLGAGLIAGIVIVVRRDRKTSKPTT